MNTCRKCTKTKPQEDFVRDKRKPSGYATLCKECEAARSKARKDAMTLEERRATRWNRKNWKVDREKQRQHTNAKRKKRREIEKLYPPLPTNILEILVEKYKRCLSCGDDKDLSRDHVVPLSRGGANTLDNLQLLCIVCNARKGTSDTDYR